MENVFFLKRGRSGVFAGDDEMIETVCKFIGK
jgi:hypothetical protein